MSVITEHIIKRQARLMGSAFEFIISDQHSTEMLDEAVAEVKRIEDLLTEFSEISQTALINQHAGVKSVKVNEEVYAIIKRAKKISELTQGAFDITAGALRKLYNFKGKDFILPDTETLKRTLKLTGCEKIDLLPDNHIYLTQPGMHIGFGAIGKGYAADSVKKLWSRKNISDGVINASGDLTAWGARPDGSLWKVGVADPIDPSRIIAWIPLQNSSVATSGDYEQYFELNGERYAHAIDPKTGKPVKGIKSVTVISASAELADALATAVMVMGVETGMHFIEQLPNTHCLIINDQNKIFTSRKLKVNLTS